MIIRGAGDEKQLDQVRIDHKRGQLTIAYPRTLLWDTSFRVRPETLGPGFGLLKTWDCAAPIVSYETLAVHVGTEEDRARTAKIIRDLRVPLYDTRLLFVRRNTIGRALIDMWRTELELGGNEQLAFLRAFYTIKPRMNALPTTWNKA